MQECVAEWGNANISLMLDDPAKNGNSVPVEEGEPFLSAMQTSLAGRERVHWGRMG